MDNQDNPLTVQTESIPPARKVWGGWATAGFGCLIFAVFVIVQVLVILAYFVSNIASGVLPTLDVLMAKFNSAQGLLLSLATIASGIIGGGLILIIVKARRAATIVEYLGFRRISRKTILVLLGITMAFVILSDAIGLVFKQPPNPIINIYSSSVSPVLFWIAVIIFAPLFEETFFRGFLFEGFRQSRIGLLATIGLTALLWALLHVEYGVYGTVVIFAAGIMLGIVRFKTNSLWSTILMHAFINLIATIQLAMSHLVS